MSKDHDKIKYLNFKEVTSTMDVAREEVISGRENIKDNYLVITAERQTAGRGREGRKWESEAGSGLYVTYAYAPKSIMPGLSLLVGLSILKTLKEFAVNSKLKWPNDILINVSGRYRKISGILIESAMSGKSVSYVLIGIGINVNQHYLPDELKAISMKLVCGNNFSINKVLSKLTEILIADLEQANSNSFLDEWWNNSLMSGAEISYLDESGKMQSGVAIGLSFDGALKILTGENVKLIYSGDVKINGY